MWCAGVEVSLDGLTIEGLICDYVSMWYEGLSFETRLGWRSDNVVLWCENVVCFGTL